jgi:hypothetical protein
LIRKRIASFAVKSWGEMAGAVNRAGEWRIFKSITFSRGVDWAMTLPRTWWHFVLDATEKRIDNKPRFASAPQMAESQQRSWISGGFR